jgi:hypothetical protein
MRQPGVPAGSSLRRLDWPEECEGATYAIAQALVKVRHVT